MPAPEDNDADSPVACQTPPLSLPASSNCPRSVQTPVKYMGHHYNSQQYRTPNTRTQNWGHLPQSSPHYPQVWSQLPQSSPHCLKTPGSVGINARLTPRLHTPGTLSRGSSKKGTPKMFTPNQPIYNPFDNNLLEKLDGSMFSPNVFAQCCSAEQTPQTFRWTVDELAMLKPADIDEMPNQPDTVGLTDAELERRAQDVIDAYFAQNLIAPSPWTNSTQKKPFVLPRTPRTPASTVGSPMVFAEMKTPASATTKIKSPSKDAVCQTTLTLPVDFDLQKVLEEHHTYNAERDSVESGAQDALSTSSLRRKLFFHGEEGTVPSPVKGSNKSQVVGLEYGISPAVSPVKPQTPQQPHRPSPMQTPGSAQFSSSPISDPRSCREPLTPFLRRCSTDPEFMDSPGFSPIGANHPGVASSQSMTPLCHPLQATPNSERDRIRQPFGSPGMSPIVVMDGSYMMTPQESQQRSRSRGQGQPLKVPIPDELRASASPDLSPHRELHGEEEEEGVTQQVAMDFEDSDTDDAGICFTAHHNKFTGLRLRPTDDQYSDHEDQDSIQQTYFVSHMSQDTGYNTNSLQLTTTQDLGTHSAILEAPSLHTNLTQQFGSLPISGHDTGVELDESSDISMKKTKQRKTVKRHVSSKTNLFGGENMVDGSLNDRDVIRRARQVLGKSISMEESQLHNESMGSPDHKPKLLHSIGVSAFPLVPPRQGEPPVDGWHNSAKILPSELAARVLQKAGEDYMRYCEEPRMRQHDNDPDQFYMVDMDQDSRSAHRVSMSAEF